MRKRGIFSGAVSRGVLQGGTTKFKTKNDARSDTEWMKFLVLKYLRRKFS